jgi:hypothetical protein
MFASTNAFFSMLRRHMCSGRPVLADWAWTNSSGLCVPLPIGNVALTYNSPAFLQRSINSRHENWRKASRAF